MLVSHRHASQARSIITMMPGGGLCIIIIIIIIVVVVGAQGLLHGQAACWAPAAQSADEPGLPACRAPRAAGAKQHRVNTPR